MRSTPRQGARQDRRRGPSRARALAHAARFRRPRRARADRRDRAGAQVDGGPTLGRGALARRRRRGAPAAIRKRAEVEKDHFVSAWLTLTRVRLGDEEALPALEELLKTEWPRWRDAAHTALDGLRGSAITARRLRAPRVEGGAGQAPGPPSPRRRRREVRGQAPAPLPGLRVALATQAAINALRGMVDRHPPVHDMPVFDLIEKVREWKTRLGA